MLRLIKHTRVLGLLGTLGLLVSCSPRVATSFWRIATPAYSDMPGYRVLYEGNKERHCYPITEACEPAWDPEYDTYHMFHHHGVAVESELMAYRIYFDKKQTIDVYCKRTPRLELATSYWYPNDSLLDAGYGYDILRVGGTVGVGSVKYWAPSPITDNPSPLRHIEDVGERQQWILKQTKNKATIAVSDVDWLVPNGKQDDPDSRQMVNLSAEYTIRAGHRDMRCDVSVSAPLEGLCTGVQSIPNKGPNDQSTITNYQLPNGTLLVSWGTDWPVNDTIKYAKETVGLAVFIPQKYAGELVQDLRNNLCLLKLSPITNNQSPIYHAHFYLTCVGATKENHPVATNATEWINYLRRWARRLK